jgi:hypothetical protein
VSGIGRDLDVALHPHEEVSSEHVDSPCEMGKLVKIPEHVDSPCETGKWVTIQLFNK